MHSMCNMHVSSFWRVAALAGVLVPDSVWDASPPQLFGNIEGILCFIFLLVPS